MGAISVCVSISAAASFDLDLVVLFFGARSEVVIAGEEAGLRINYDEIIYYIQHFAFCIFTFQQIQLKYQTSSWLTSWGGLGR